MTYIYRQLPWAGFFNRRCPARLSKADSVGFYGRCELRRHWGNVPHALERGMIWIRWTTKIEFTEAGSDL